jgi:hypothetical protein
MVYKSLKLIHLLGLALFLGSVFGHIATGALPGAGTPAFIAARENISLLTRVLTLPGLGLAMASGVAMVLSTRMKLIRARWVLLHATLAIVVVLLTVLIVAPAGKRVLAAARTGTESAIQAGLWTEHLFGAANIVLVVAVMAVAIWRPRLTRRIPPV